MVEWWDRAGPPIFTRRVRRASPVSGKNKCNLYWWHLGPGKAQGVSRPLILIPRHPSRKNWNNLSKLGIPDPFRGMKPSSFGRQLKSPFSEGKNPGSFSGRYPSTGPLTSYSTVPAGVVSPHSAARNFVRAPRLCHEFPKHAEVKRVWNNLRNHFLLALRISGICLVLKYMKQLARVPVILKDTVTFALVCPLSEINKDL